MILFFRLSLTAVLIYFIYGETGPVTAITFFLMAMRDEAITCWIRTVNKALSVLAEHKGMDDLLARLRSKS